MPPFSGFEKASQFFIFYLGGGGVTAERFDALASEGGGGGFKGGLPFANKISNKFTPKNHLLDTLDDLRSFISSRICRAG